MPSFAASASQHLNVKIKNTGGFGGSSYGAGNADRLLKHYNSQGFMDRSYIENSCSQNPSFTLNYASVNP